MRQMRLPLLLCVFVLVTWPGTSPAPGIPFDEWVHGLAEHAHLKPALRLTALGPDPAPLDLSDITPPGEQESGEQEGASGEPSPPATPEVAIEDVCVAMASAAQTSDLPVGFFARLIWQESKFGQWAVSRAGAQGVAQFMPDTAAWIGLRNPFDPIAALSASARFLRMLHAQFGNLGLAAAAYNAGPGRVQTWLAGRGPLPDETRNYVRSVTGHDAETWMTPRELDVSFHLPSRAPCEGLAGLSRANAPEKIAVALDPAIARLIETARAEAAAKARKAKEAMAKRLAGKKRAAAKSATDTGKKASDAKPATAKTKTAKTAATAKSTAAKPAPGRPLKIATN